MSEETIRILATEAERARIIAVLRGIARWEEHGDRKALLEVIADNLESGKL